MTDRDKKILAVVAVLVFFGGYWLLVLGKQRSAVSEARTARDEAQQQLQQAIAAQKTGLQEKKKFPVSYARVIKLGKAIPADDDFASLLVQIDDTVLSAGGGKVIFRALTTSDSAAGGPSGPVSGSTTCDSGATGATGATAPAPGATGATGPTPANTGVGQAINNANAGATASSADANRAGASTADEAAKCAASPSLTDLAAAASGLALTNYNLTFEGSYFDLHRVFNRVLRLVRTRNGRVRSLGRLLQINTITLAVNDFPLLQATVSMTGYTLPKNASATAGATPAGPAGAPAATAAPAPSADSSAAPPAAVAGAR